MHKTNLKSLDLNLLVALKALLDERHVTRAADQIGLSQPAMSRALSRLRIMFKDSLLVKSTNGFCLTPRAEDLYQPLQALLTEIGQLVSPPLFDLGSVQKEMIIATRDYETTVVLPNIINAVAHEAPGLTFRVLPLAGDDLSPLERQEVDFVIAGSESQASTLSRYVLFKENYICLVSAKNSKKLSLKHYLSMNHCLVTIKNSGHGIVDTVLHQKNLKRNITVRVPHFLAAAHIVEKSNLIITLPYRLGVQLSQPGRLIGLTPPIKLPSFPVYLYWHIRNQNNPIHAWLRKIIRASCEEKF